MSQDQQEVKKGPGCGVALLLLVVILILTWWMVTAGLHLKSDVAWQGGFALWGLALAGLYKHQIEAAFNKYVVGFILWLVKGGVLVVVLGFMFALILSDRAVPYQAQNTLSSSLAFIDGEPYAGPTPGTRSEIWQILYERTVAKFGDLPNLEQYVDKMLAAVIASDVPRFQTVLAEVWQDRLARSGMLYQINPMYLLVYIAILAIVSGWLKEIFGSIAAKLGAFVLILATIIYVYGALLPIQGIRYGRDMVEQGMLLYIATALLPTMASVASKLGGIRPTSRGVRFVWSSGMMAFVAILSINVYVTIHLSPKYL